MAITRYSALRPTISPWADFDLLGSRFGRLLEDINGLERVGNGPVAPAVNIEETPEQLTLTAELPGMKQEDINIELENNVLTISGEKFDERTEEDAERRYHLWERKYGSFQRSFTLPRTVMADGISASFDSGVLTVHMPKIEEAKGRRIAIGGGVEAKAKAKS
jgi:HSP20 family protein